MRDRQYDWDMGDGAGSVPAGRRQADILHYAAAGTYIITLSVSNPGGSPPSRRM